MNSGNTAIDTLSFEQDWSLDQVGNWAGFDQDDNGNGTDDLVQTRTHNKANEITGISNTTGGSWMAPAYDNAGNTMTLPTPEAPASGFTAVYDAWNRLVGLKEQSTGTKVAEYIYDARGMRVRKETHNLFGIVESTTDYYYTASWQCVEEITTGTGSSSSSSSSGMSGGTTTYVWGLRYIDDLVERSTTPTGSSTTRYYALNDRNFNITALANTSGTVLERYVYTAYGQRTVLDASFNVRSGSLYGQQHGFQGLRHDQESGLIENRSRVLHPLLGRFLQRDPLGYTDGMNLCAAYHVMWSGVDPWGLKTVAQACPEAIKILRQLEQFHQDLADKWDNLAGKTQKEMDLADFRIDQMKTWTDDMLKSQPIKDLKELIGLEGLAGLAGLGFLAELDRNGIDIAKITGTGRERAPDGTFRETRTKRALNRMGKAKAPGVAMIASILSKAAAVFLDIQNIQGEMSNMMSLRQSMLGLRAEAERMRDGHLSRVDSTQSLIRQLQNMEMPDCKDCPDCNAFIRTAKKLLAEEKKKFDSASAVKQGNDLLDDMKDASQNIWDSATDIAN